MRALLLVLVLGSSEALAGSHHCCCDGRSSFLLEKGPTELVLRVDTVYERSLGDTSTGDVSAHAQFVDIAEELASMAGATLFYLRPTTERKIPSGAVWRASNPLEILRAFAAAAGLEVAVVSDDFWLIGPPEEVREQAVRLFAYPMDQATRGEITGEKRATIEKLLLRSLPIREAQFDGSANWVGLGYSVVADEGADTFLVVGTIGGDERTAMQRTFKVRIAPRGAELGVECLWSSNKPMGPVLAAINEDLDDDGVRDFVFLAGDEERVPMMILSGADGHVLVSVNTFRLVVEKHPVSARRFAVDLAPGIPQEAGPVMFSYEAGRREFIRETGALRALATGGTDATQESVAATGPIELLSRLAGGREKLRVYLLPGARVPPSEVAHTEVIRVAQPQWGLTASAVSGGARVVFERRPVDAVQVK